MGKTKAVIWNSFVGGIATDEKIGIPHSGANLQAVDFRKSPSQFSTLPGLQREDQGNIKDLIQQEVMIGDGTIWGLGNTGWIYKRTTPGTWTTEGKLGTGTAGLDWRDDMDSLFATSTKTVSRVSTVSSSPALQPDLYGPSISTYNNSTTAGFNVNADQETGVGGILSVTLSTSFTEILTSTRFFQTDIEPLSKISVYVRATSGATLTLTLHDGDNNTLATATNASVSANAWNDFTFASQVRVYPAPDARTYHFHLTAASGTNTVSSTATNDLSTCDLRVYADRLVQTNNGLHPIQRFQQFETIGNGNYLSVWEPISPIPTNAEWLRHKLIFPQKYEVCGLALQNEFLVIAVEQHTNFGTSIPQSGRLYFWDGLSTSWNFLVDVPEGSPQALTAYRNVIYYFAGGSWYAITAPNTLPVKIRTMPFTDTEFTGTVAPTTGASGNPLAATLQDDFHDPTLNTSKWDSFGNYSLPSGVLQLTTNTGHGSHGISSHVVYEMTGSSIQSQIISVGNQALASFQVFPVLAQIDSSNQLFWMIQASTIYAKKRVGAVTTTLNSTGFVITTHTYLRIREQNGTTYWDYSPDAIAWTNFASSANPIAVTALTLEIQAGNTADEFSTTSAQFDNFNIIPSTPISNYPYTAAVRRGVLLAGFPSVSLSADTVFGVYSWGSVSKNFPDAFGYSYILSTGSQQYLATNNLQIGMVKSFGDLLHVSWRDDSIGAGTPVYGIDKIDNTSPPASYSYWQTLIFDDGYVGRLKTAKAIEVTWASMPTGVTFTIDYQIDRSGTWEISQDYSATEQWFGRNNYARFNIDSGMGRFYEIQVMVEVYCSSVAIQPPDITSVSLVYDDGSGVSL